MPGGRADQADAVVIQDHDAHEQRHHHKCLEAGTLDDLGVDLAQQAGLTLIGRAKGRRFVALAGAERIVFDSDGREIGEETARSSRKSSLPEEAA